MQVKLPLTYGDYRNIIKNFIYNQWQLQWSIFGTCRLKNFKPILGDWKSAYRDVRSEEKKLSRLRTGTCLFLKQHIFDPQKPRETCRSCNVNLSIKHIIIDCPSLQNSRQRIIDYLNQRNLNLSEEVILCDAFPHGLLFAFLKETPFYRRI